MNWYAHLARVHGRDDRAPLMTAVVLGNQSL
jgi:hypothetical protein